MFIKNISFVQETTNRNKPNTQKYQIASPLPALQPDTISFKGNRELSGEEKFARALDIVECFSKKQIQNMDDFDQRHLDGIQYGLKTFENLTFPEVYFLLTNMGELCIPVVRDCAGMCPACNVNGRPAEKSTTNISRMDFEDYKTLTDDLKEITKRLNFDCLAKSIEKSKNDTKEYDYYTMPSAALFYDSDCKDVRLKDKNGVIHEFPELNKMLYEATGLKGLFDTAGWSPRNSVMQKRMEAIADYYSKPEHKKEIDQINISVNTYHGIMEKANEYKKSGDLASYERMKKVYINNIVNAMYTFTPLLDKGIYQLLLKSVDNSLGDKFKDYNQDTAFDLFADIFKSLHNRYLQDLKNKNFKYVKTEDDIYKIVEKHMYSSSPLLTYLTPSARNNIFSTIGSNYQYIKDNKNADFTEVMQKKTNHLLIDVNGKAYICNDNETFNTDIQLNFNNKTKEAKQIYPLPDPRVIRVKEKSFH